MGNLISNSKYLHNHFHPLLFTKSPKISNFSNFCKIGLNKIENIGDNRSTPKECIGLIWVNIVSDSI